MRRRDFLKTLGGTGIAVLLGSGGVQWFTEVDAKAQTQFGDWPMFRRNPAHLGTTDQTGRVSSNILKWRYPVIGDVEACPAVGDINGDGMLEVVIGSFRGLVAAVRGNSSGVIQSPLWQFDAGDTTERNTPLIWSSPAIGDVDGDGQVEVVIGSDNTNVYILNGSTGNPKWIFPTTARVRSSPMIDDIDGDGRPEIVVTSGLVYALDAQNRRTKWTYPFDTFAFASPAIADIDGDGRKEVVIGDCDGILHVLDGPTGNLKWQFLPEGIRGTRIDGSVALADVDGDGEIEVIMGCGKQNFSGTRDNLPDGVYVLRGSNGAVKWSYDIGVDQRIVSSPAIGDVDGDGQLEVVIGSNANKLFVFTGAGSSSGQGVVKHSYQLDKFIESSPALGDIDGDGNVEIVVGSHDFHVYSFEVVPGQEQLREEWSFGGGNIFFSSPTLTDVDQDGQIEVIIGNNDGNMYCFGV